MMDDDMQASHCFPFFYFLASFFFIKPKVNNNYIYQKTPPTMTIDSVLQDTERLIIQQKIEWGEAAAQAAANAIDMEALGAFGETCNEYSVFGDDGGGEGQKKFRVVETR